MSNGKRLVSVIIPTYNCARFISEAIESVLSQTYKNLEIIIVDDGSTDDTKDILSPYIENNLIRYFYQRNKGAAAARNEGIGESRGYYIAFLDADDLWLKEKLAKSVEFLESRGFDWICTGIRKITMEGGLLEDRLISDSAYGYDANTGELYDLSKGLFSYSFSLPVHAPTMLIRKECFEKSGNFDERIKICEDTDLTLRFQAAGLRGGFLNEMLSVYRLRRNSTTKKSNIEGLGEHRKVARLHAKRLGFTSGTRKDYANLLWELAARYYINKRPLETIKLLSMSLFYYPQNINRIVKIKKIIFK